MFTIAVHKKSTFTIIHRNKLYKKDKRIGMQSSLPMKSRATGSYIQRQRQGENSIIYGT